MTAVSTSGGSQRRLVGGGLARLSSTLLAAGALFHTSSNPSVTESSVSRSLSSASLENVLRGVLTKLSATLTSRKCRSLKDEVHKMLDLLKSLIEDQDGSGTDAEQLAPVSRGDMLRKHNVEFFRPLQMACETRSVRVVLAALDGIQKLLACGFFSGSLDHDSACMNSSFLPSGTSHRQLSDATLSRGYETDISSLPEPIVTHGVPNRRDSKDSVLTTTSAGAQLGAASRLLIDQVVFTVLSTSDMVDDAVQLQVIRCILTAVTAIQCDDLHGETLVAAVRGVFKVYRRSKDVQNQRTAQAALTQIVNSVMRPLEAVDTEEKRVNGNGGESLWPIRDQQRSIEKGPPELHGTLSSSAAPSPALAVVDDNVPGDQLSADNHSVSLPNTEISSNTCSASVATPDAHTNTAEGSTRTTQPATENSVSSASPGATFKVDDANKVDDDVEVNSVGVEGGVMTSATVAGTTFDDRQGGLGSRGLLDEGSKKEKLSDPTVATGESIEEDAGACEAVSHPVDGQTPEAGVEPVDSIKVDSEKAVGASVQAAVVPNEVVQDALLVFSTLCSLSLDDDPMDESTVNDSSVVRVKRLSLELLLSILQNRSKLLRTLPQFVSCIRSSLCISLIKNCMSYIPKIFGVALSIFSVLAVDFKDRLAPEIGVFVNQILFRILESSNPSYEHKRHVLQVLHGLFTDPSVALELYFNFDCDVGEKDVFMRTVTALAKLAQGPEKSTGNLTPEQQGVLQRTALETLVTLLRALLNWVKECQDRDHSTTAYDAVLQDASEVQASCAGQSEDHLGHTDSDDKATASYPHCSDSSASGGSGLSPSVVGGKSNGAATLHPHDFMMTQQRQRKQGLHQGIALFNHNPAKGVAFLIEKGYVEETPSNVAAFLLCSSGLQKKAIGAYLGEPDAFNQQVLRALVDQMEFQSMEIDTALRKFLSTFRLPGEAQKIDRMMETFASKYVLDNPGKFVAADCAYVLAFSLIMLHTDAHSRSIKPESKMTLEMFIRNNRGINDNADLPADYLEFLYRRIVAEEWVVEDDEEENHYSGRSGALDGSSGGAPAFDAQQQFLEGLALALGLSTPSAGRRKFELFLKESKGIVTKTTELIQQKKRERYDMSSNKAVPKLVDDGGESGRTATADVRSAGGEVLSTEKAANAQQPRIYIRASPELVGQVQFLFHTIHGCLITTFLGIIRGEPLTSSVTDLLLDGLSTAIQLASRFDQVTEAEPFVSTLATFTGLTFMPNVDAIETTLLSAKHFSAVQCIFDILLTQDGFNVFGSSWKLVLECCSQLSILFQVATTRIKAEATAVRFSDNGPQSILDRNRATPVQSGSGEEVRRLRSDADGPADGVSDPRRLSSGTDVMHNGSRVLPVAPLSPPTSISSSTGPVMFHKKSGGSLDAISALTAAPASAPRDALPAFPSPTESPTQEPLSVLQLNAFVATENLDPTHLDLLFTRSRLLSSAGIVAFVTCLCEVSKEELQLPEPRIFSLQKLVEVADYNMNRIRLIWSKIWAVLLQHFVDASLHPRIDVALYAVDSLRQLAVKFLEKDELSNYSFQMEFLKPFLIVMRNEKVANDVKIFIIEILFHIIQMRAKNIKSGWKSVFHILSAVPATVSAHQAAVHLLCQQAFDVLKYILRCHFWTAAFGYMGEVVRCLVAFAALSKADQDITAEPASLFFNTITSQAFEYLEALAVVLVGDEYSTYCESMGKVYDGTLVIMEGGLPRLKESEDEAYLREPVLAEQAFSLAPTDAPQQRAVGSLAASTVPAPEIGRSAERYIALLRSVRYHRERGKHASEQVVSSGQELSGDDDSRSSETAGKLNALTQELQMYLSGYWFPIFTGLTQLATSLNVIVKTRMDALDSLFRLFSYLGKDHMSQDMWQMTIRGVVFPLFDDLHLHLHREQRHPQQHLQQVNERVPQQEAAASLGSVNVDPDDISKRGRVVSDMQTMAGRPAAPDEQLPSTALPPAWAQLGCQAALTSLVRLVDEHYASLTPFLGEILALIGSCIRGGQPEPVARLGIDACRDLVSRICARCSAKEWDRIITALEGYFRDTVPHELLQQHSLTEETQHSSAGLCDPPGGTETAGDVESVSFARSMTGSGAPPDALNSLPAGIGSRDSSTLDQPQQQQHQHMNLPFIPSEVIRNCVVQLLLIELVNAVTRPVVRQLVDSHVERLLTVLMDAYHFAHRFNRQVGWRYRLKQLGFMKSIQQLPRLLKQEREGLRCSFELLFQILCYSDDREHQSEHSSLNRTASASLLRLFHELAEDFMERQRFLQENLPVSDVPPSLSVNAYVYMVRAEAEREVTMVTALLLNTVIKGFEDMPQSVFEANVSDIFVVFIKIMSCSPKVVRDCVKELLLSRVAPVLSHYSSGSTQLFSEQKLCDRRAATIPSQPSPPPPPA